MAFLCVLHVCHECLETGECVFFCSFLPSHNIQSKRFALRSFTVQNPAAAPPQAESPAGASSSSLLWVVIVVVALLALAVVIVLILVVRRKQNASDSSADIHVNNELNLAHEKAASNSFDDVPIYGDGEYEWDPRESTGRLTDRRKGTQVVLRKATVAPERKSTSAFSFDYKTCSPFHFDKFCLNVGNGNSCAFLVTIAKLAVFVKFDLERCSIITFSVQSVCRACSRCNNTQLTHSRRLPRNASRREH